MFSGYDNEALAALMRIYAKAQDKYAAEAKEDFAHWHHAALRDMLSEGAKRLETTMKTAHEIEYVSIGGS